MPSRCRRDGYPRGLICYASILQPCRCIAGRASAPCVHLQPTLQEWAVRAFRKERLPADPTKLSEFTRAEQLLKEVCMAVRVCMCL
jgi:hypothetical protein